MRALYSTTIRRRFLAYLIDLLAIMAIVVVTLLVTIFTYGAWKYAGDERMIKDLVASPQTAAFAQVAHAVFYFSYFTLAHWYFGQTVGKWVTGVEVKHHRHGLSLSRSVLRSFGYLLSGSFTFGLGYLPALFRRDERTLHDIIADTDVVLTASVAANSAPRDESRAA